MSPHVQDQMSVTSAAAEFLAPNCYTTLSSGRKKKGYISIGLPEQIPDQNSQLSHDFILTFWVLSTRHGTQRKVLRSFSSNLSYACFFLTSLYVWTQDYHPLPHQRPLSKDSCMPSQCSPFTAPTPEWWFNFGLPETGMCYETNNLHFWCTPSQNCTKAFYNLQTS